MILCFFSFYYFSLTDNNYTHLWGTVWCFDISIQCEMVKSSQLTSVSALPEMFEILILKYMIYVVIDCSHPAVQWISKPIPPVHLKLDML